MAHRERVFDEMLCFLSEPIFQVPVRSFMDENCMIFDTEAEITREHREIFDRYKKLIDALLEAFCEDAKITIDEAIKGISRLNKIPDLHDVFHGLFEQVLAATDFDVFYTAMAKRNIMIQEQVLAMILAATGALPASFMRGESVTDARGGRQTLAADDQQEEEILRRVIQLSKTDRSAVPRRAEQLGLESTELKHEVKSLARERTQLDEQMQKLVIGDDRADRYDSKSSKSSSFEKYGGDARSSGAAKNMTTEQAANAWLRAAESESSGQSSAHAALTASLSQLSPAELKQRQDFLRQQRDKLLAMKKEAREKQLQDAEQSQHGSKRPVSARVARSAMQDDSREKSKETAENEKKMAMRRAIAEKLREEVVGKQ